MVPMTSNEKNVYNFLLSFIHKDKIVIHDRSHLLNPKSGRFLEMDFYLPEFKLGIEVQGIGHEFCKSRERDCHKYTLAKKMGIRIIYISSPITRENLYDLLNQINFIIKKPNKWREII